MNLTSDESWEVFITNGRQFISVGQAQPVCLNTAVPNPCPAGAAVYGNPSTTAWSANLSSIPGAKWIWAPGITGATPNADLNQYRFVRTFQLASVPETASLAIAADSAATVQVNGVTVGSIGSVSSATAAQAAQSALSTINLKPQLVVGTNTITVIAQNNSRALSGCTSSCTYAQNPAGVVFGAMLATTQPPGSFFGEGDEPTNPTLVIGVNTATGNYYYRSTDLRVRNRVLPFVFARHYNSQDPYVGPFGQGWTHSYNARLFINGSTVKLKELDGQEVLFSLVTSGVCPPITPGVTDVLTRNSNGTFTLVRDDRSRQEFTATGLLTSSADQNGNAFTFQYTSGNLTKILDTAGRAFTLAYNANNRVVSLTDPAGRTVQYGYDGPGRLVSVTDPAGGVTRYVYDSSNRIVSSQDPRSVSFVQNTYDAQNRVIETKDAEGAITRFAYNTPVLRTTTKTDPLGRITLYTYDAGLRLIRLTDALGGVTTYGYDSQNRRTSMTDANGFTTTYTYDARGNRTSITNPLGQTITVTYDARNTITGSVDAAGRVASFQYDTNGNRTRMTTAAGSTTYQYGAYGNLTAIVDALSRSNTFTYDAANNLLTVQDPLGRITRYEYDILNNKISAVNGNGAETTYTYDTLNRVVNSTDPLGNTTQFGYDAAGNVTSVRSPRGTLDRFTYDGRNNLTAILYANGTAATFAYNAVGKRTRMVDSLGTTTYLYDALDRIIQINYPGSKVVSYTYDAVGNRLSMTYPDAKRVTYAYDAANRLVRVTDWLARNTTYTHNAAGQPLTITYPTGRGTTFTYDAAGRVSQVQNLFGPSTAVPPFAVLTYTYDAVGNRNQVINAAGVVTSFGYDAADQLTAMVTPSGTTTYGYDGAGNRVSRTGPGGTIGYTYDAASRILSAGSTTFSHDPAGNMTRRVTPSGTFQYLYDTANRLIRAVGPGVSSSYSYDGDGNRKRQITAAGTYDYVIDIVDPLVSIIQETGPDGAITYVRGRAQTPISMSATGVDRFYHYDGLGTVLGLSDSTGLQEAYSIDAWGNNLVAPAPGVATRNKFRFLGEPQDPGTGFYYLRARYYDPDLGRFLTKDPVPGFAREPLSQNPYIYSLNNPLRYSDRTGRYPDWYDDPWSDQESYSDGTSVDALDPPEWPYQPAWP